MRTFLAVDAGGTSTRAVLVDAAGRCLGSGRAAGGNPTSRGADEATGAVLAAIAAAVGEHGPSVDSVLLAHAGSAAGFHEGVAAALAPLGVQGTLRPAGDVEALFASGTAETEGAALIAGTGAIGGAVRDGALVRLVDGTGWLLGDAGSGFWIGHRVARAVVDDLDGGPATRLTAALLSRFGLEAEPGAALVQGRPPVLSALVQRLYAIRPVALSSLAPLAFEAAGDDAVAGAIVREAVGALSALLARVRTAQPTGPLVLGGSVLVHGVLRLGDDLLAPFRASAGDAVPVEDGLVGAAVLALRAGGVEVDAALHQTLSAGIRTFVP